MPRREARRLKRCTEQLASIGPLPAVRPPLQGKVLIAALTQSAIRARGKVEPHLFFPDFCAHLAAQGIACEFVFHAEDLARRSREGPNVIIHLYDEERALPDLSVLEEAHSHAAVVFNHPSTGAIIANKVATNAFLTGKGIAMPSMDIAPDDPVFSNEVANTSKPAWVVSAVDMDRTRYNTRYIDSRADFEGQTYFTTVRLLTVGDSIVYAFVGARSANANKPRVHGVNTPLNAGLIMHLYETLFEANRDRMEAIARDLDAALGPGFYHHDLIVEHGTGDIYLCETGYKFDAYAYGARLKSLKDKAPCLEPFLSPVFARRSADLVIETWQKARAGKTNAPAPQHRVSGADTATGP